MNGRPEKARGFTILELLIAISIAMIILGAGAGLTFRTISIEKRMSRIAGKIETAAREASISAHLNRNDVFLYLYKDKVAGQKGGFDVGNTALEMKRPGLSTKWISPPEPGYAWKFDQSGLCEPLSIKLTFDGGTITLEFDPLTGEVREKTMVIDEAE